VWEVCAHTKYATLKEVDLAEVEALRARRGLTSWERARTCLVASAHWGDMAVVLGALQALASLGLMDEGSDEGSGRLRALVCPRYPEDGARMAAALEGLGLRVRREGEGWSRGPKAAQVVVVETMGELRALYGCARVAVMGGTLCQRGGQNPMEAAAAGCRVIVGPHTAQIEVELGRMEADTIAGEAGALAKALRVAMAQGGGDSDGRAQVEAAMRVALEAREASERQAQRVIEALR
jgi:3-deoxy-D-manno-octulosonic-acid transferase